MPTVNNTWNQHYYSQAEQKLNAANPPRRTRIHAFQVVDREKLALELVRSDGVKIEQNLSFRDLFSVHVEGRLRTNLEKSFQRFEDNIGKHSKTLVTSAREGNVADLKEPLVEVFAAKLANFARNPFSIRKVLNTFNEMESYRPDRALRAAYDLFLRGRRPQKAFVCSQFNVTEDEYERWLRVLVALHMPAGNGRLTHVEQIVKHLFESHNTAVSVHDYSTLPDADACLLSDRSVTVIDRSDELTFECNLSSHSFVRFTFMNMSKKIRPHFLPHIRAEAPGLLQAQVVLAYRPDDLEILRLFNSRAIYQCAGHVYSASPKMPTLPPG